MPYRAVINYDFSDVVDGNVQNRLASALIQAGWIKAETTAFYIERDDLPDIWRGFEVVAKRAAITGTLSAFTFHVQLEQMTPFAALAYHGGALTETLALEWPQ